MTTTQPTSTSSSSASSSPSRTNLEPLLSSKSEDWATPDDLYNTLDDIFGFELDVAASHENAKCPRYFTKEDDALTKDWDCSTAFCNPPYGSKIAGFMQKAYEESQKGTTVVCLVPARTDTRWWHDYAAKGSVFFLPGRLKFGNAKHSAPFPSAIVIFWPSPLNRAICSH